MNGILDDEDEAVAVLMMTCTIPGIVEDEEESLDHIMRARKAKKQREFRMAEHNFNRMYFGPAPSVAGDIFKDAFESSVRFSKNLRAGILEKNFYRTNALEKPGIFP